VAAVEEEEEVAKWQEQPEQQKAVALLERCGGEPWSQLLRYLLRT